MLLVKELVNFSKREYVIAIIEVIEILGQCFLKLIVQFNRHLVLKEAALLSVESCTKTPKTLPFLVGSNLHVSVSLQFLYNYKKVAIVNEVLIFVAV